MSSPITPNSLRILALIGLAAAVPNRAAAQGGSRPILGNSLATAPAATPATFYAIQVTVLGPASARVDWGNFLANPKASTGTPVDNYQVWRSDLPGGPIAKVSATTMTWTDGSLRDARTYTYYVTANPAPQTTQRLTGPGTVQGQTAQVTNNNPLPLGTSNAVTVTTPSLQPPTGLTATVSASAPSTVKLSWTPAAYAQSYIVWRNGQVIGRYSGATSDVPPVPGWYDYQVASALPEQGYESVSARTPAVSAHTGPLTVLIVGGSLMWGEGLADANKIATAVGGLVQGITGQPPTIVNLAHAGAYVAPPSTDSPALAAQREAMAPLAGEVPSPYPTVRYQLLTAGPARVAPANVDLVLLEGCIHDVGFRTLLDPKTTDADLSNISLASCTAAASLIDQAQSAYPRARIFIVGYPVLISPQTDRASLNALATLSGVAAKDIETLIGVSLAPLAGVPPDPLLTTVAIVAGAAVNAAKTADSLKYLELAKRHAEIFAAEYEAVMQAKLKQQALAAQQKALLDQKAGKPADPLGSTTVMRVPAPFDPSNSYAAPNSYLWQVPTTQGHDDVFTQRQALCDVQAATRGMAGLGECLEASAGFPNRGGAAAIVNAMMPQLSKLVLAWKNAYAPK